MSTKKFNWQLFIPKSVICFKEGYSWSFFINDLLAGITVGLISLPLVMAFAIGSGVDPERGLYTAIIAGFMISLLGGSRFQIAGPTGAFVVIVYSIVQRHGYDGLATATLLAGLMLFLLGITRCGAFIKFIPYPVTTGFISGIATVLFTAQIRDFFGLAISSPSPDFTTRLGQYWTAIGTINPWACAMGAMTLAIIIYLKKRARKVPGAIIAVVITAIFTYLFDLPITTVEKMFGPVPNTLPEPSLPKISFDNLHAVFPDAITIALLGAIESLLTCVIADTMTGTRHKSNTELMAQGIGNILSPLFGGIPATGAIARTTANVQLQAKTPVSGMINALTLFVFMFFFAGAAGKIPLASLAAILMFISYNMSEMERFTAIIRGPRSDRLVLLTTYLLTVLFDLTVAAQVGILLACFLFLKHMSEKTTMRVYEILQHEEEPEKPVIEKPLTVPQGTRIFEIEGPFFFGVADMVGESYRRLEEKPTGILLRMRNVPLVDASGMQALNDFADRLKKDDVSLSITEVRPDVMHALSKGGVVAHIGADKFIPISELVRPQQATV